MGIAEHLHACVLALAERCDGAHARDEQGFSAAHVAPGKVLAATPPEEWDADTREEAYSVLSHYRAQLKRYGLDLVDAGPAEPIRWDRTRQHGRTLRLQHRGGYILARSCYPPAPAVRERLDACPGRRWSGEEMCWKIPHTVEAVQVLRTAAEAFPTAVRILGTLPDPPADAPPHGKLRVRLLDDGRVGFLSRYHPGGIIELVKALPGREAKKLPDGSWDWIAPPSDALLELLRDHGDSFVDAEPAGAALAAKIGAMDDHAELSNAAESSFEPRGLKPAAGLSPYPYQRAGTAYAVKARRCFLADEMGLGKGLQAIGTVAHLDYWPALIVCPSVLKPNLQREVRMWTGREATILSGTTPEPADLEADAVILNYEILPAWEEALTERGFRSLIVDESHRAKKLIVRPKPGTKGTLRSAALYRVANAMRKADPDAVQLLLSGTPVVNHPGDLIAQLRIMGRLNDLGGYRHFVSTYCVRGHGGRGIGRGGKNLDDLNKALRRICYVRRTKAQVLPELPAKQWASVPIPIEGKALRIYEAKIEEIRAFARARPDWRRTGGAEALTRISAARQAMAAAKLPAIEEWVGGFLADSDRKLVLFAHHRSVTEALAERFNAPAIIGGISPNVRQASIDAFQSDPDCRLLVCAIDAAGIGLNLTAASDVAFAESGWTPAAMDQAICRCDRIGQRNSVTGWQLYGTKPAGDDGTTIDEWMLDLIAQKRETVDEATDGRESMAFGLMAAILGDADASSAAA